MTVQRQTKQNPLFPLLSCLHRAEFRNTDRVENSTYEAESQSPFYRREGHGISVSIKEIIPVGPDEVDYRNLHKPSLKGNHPHRSYATIPQNSSANLAQNSDLRASSSMDKINSSMQQSILNDIHQRTGYEENAADEIFVQYGVTKPNRYNPETSEFMFPGMQHIQENEPNSTHFQMASEVFIHQNSQNYGPINQNTLQTFRVCN
ncbi:hypothetical protein CEXT_216851 [Caerostris extrusa]|uniref:Uncharacterized protein n=1 Tax=Caerostris extrusa TaxID=172846 RepID=A0AAV4VG21_CAEEX|nr:hypothetical protein CEXT_216851 [Caerostris extrusa]